MSERDLGVVLAAAGVGQRFGSAKQFLEVAGRPVLHYSLDSFSAVEEVIQVVVVLPPADLDAGRRCVAAWQAERQQGPGRCPRLDFAPGGARRQDSVETGLGILGEGVKNVLVHDAARPLVRPEDIRRVAEAVRERGAAVLGTPCHDSVKRARGGRIVEELPREEVWTVQTPQGARLHALRDAYARGRGRELTDEASALRAAGIDVFLVEGPRENLKITRPGDEVLAALLLDERRRG